MFLQSLVAPDNSGASWDSPALLMQTSTPPNWALIFSNMAIISSSFLTSHLMATSLPAAELRSLARDYQREKDITAFLKS